MQKVQRSPRTTAAYTSDWNDFSTWCAHHGKRTLPAAASVVAAYLDDLASRYRASTVERRVAAIRAQHVDAGLTSPTDVVAVRDAVTRARWRGRYSATPTVPLDPRELGAISAALESSLAGTRDRALLLVAYGAGLRPSEVVALTCDDVGLVPTGLAVRVSRGRVVVPFGSDHDRCAVRAWKAWRAAAGIGDGPAFRAVDRHGRLGTRALSEKAVTRIVRRAAERAGLDGARWSGLSLRRGMVMAATEHGVTVGSIMEHTGHRSRRVVRDYMRGT